MLSYVSRWPMALRVAMSSAIVMLAGLAAGDIGAGLVATLGVFTANYGSDRPYRNRGAQLAVIAVALAAAVTIGAWAATVTIGVAVVAVSVIAVFAVWLCAALSVGPPGAYMFVVVCAAGAGISASHRPAWQIGLLVLAGGAIGWIGQMSGVLMAPRGPEKAAVAAAGQAVAGYLDTVGTSDSTIARRRAATALSRAWAVLVDYQPRSAPGGRLRGLREANHALHVLFTDAMTAVGQGRAVSADAAAIARAIATEELDPGVVANRDPGRAPLRRPPTVTLLNRAIRPGAQTRWVMTRVGIAAPVAGGAAGMLGMGHVYWAMAAAVLMLHQGAHRAATVKRGAQRVLGTVVGLGLAAAILSAHPQGLWLVLVVAALQFAIELVVVRNYGLATVFITGIALTIASAGGRTDVGVLILDRGADTAIGCGVGLAVYLLAVRRQEAHRIDESVVSALEGTIAATRFLARGDADSLASRAARRDLQDRIFDLAEAEEAARHGSGRDRAAATRLAPIAAAAEHLGYATVAACWDAEQRGDSVFGTADPESYLDVLQEISESARTSTVPPVAEELPPFAAPEVRLLSRALSERR